MSDSIDPRRGVPSASAMERYDACPGSWLASTLCPPSPDNADSTAGTRIHAALETGDMAALSADEGETADMCKSQTEKILEEWNNENL